MFENRSITMLIYLLGIFLCFLLVILMSRGWL
jgi:hypothetical protein